MNAPLPRRFLLRLALPLAGVAAMVAMAEPLPQPAQSPDPVSLVQEEVRAAAERVRMETAQLQLESQEAAERARASAAAMRWLITLPAASGRRCLVDSCTE